VAVPPAPVANAGPGQTAKEGSSVQFGGSVTGGGHPPTYTWGFGGHNTASGTPTPTHVYADDGAHTGTLTVQHAPGRQSQATTTATVQMVPPTPSAHGPYGGTVGTAIAFTGSATDPSPVDTAAGFGYLWNFGDGTTSTLQSPAHTYAAAGNYTVTLT